MKIDIFEALGAVQNYKKINTVSLTYSGVETCTGQPMPPKQTIIMRALAGPGLKKKLSALA